MVPAIINNAAQSWCAMFLLVFIFLLELTRASTISQSMMCPLSSGGCTCLPSRRIRCCCVGEKISDIPKNLSRGVKILTLYNTSITSVDQHSFQAYLNIEELEINTAPFLTNFQASSVAILPNLRKLSITGCKQLEEINGTLIGKNHKIQSLFLADNGFRQIPELEMNRRNQFEYFSVDVDLSSNAIESIGKGRVRGLRASTFRLSYNKLTSIDSGAFPDCHFITLILTHNPQLTLIAEDAFADIVFLENLDLSHTSIKILPSAGLKKLKTIVLRNVPTLKKLPSVLAFTELQKAAFTYPHHCCLFKHVDQTQEFGENSKEIYKRICKSMGKRISKRHLNMLENEHIPLRATTPSIFETRRPTIATGNAIIDMLFHGMFNDEDLTDDEDESALQPFDEEDLGVEVCKDPAKVVEKYYYNISCTPEPDALNPCENIVGYPLLRMAIWVVWIAAILGNAIVWVVLFMAFEGRLRIHYFFMFNLALADFITGIYLAFLAIKDSQTADEYYRFAVGWQTGWGCQTAGFLAVFASQLSIISMFFIAFEMAYSTRMAMRGYTIRMWCAVLMMTCGYVYSAVMAVLPLIGISSYSTTSICLPLTIESTGAQVYLLFGLIFNLFAFLSMAWSYIYILWLIKCNNSTSEMKDPKAKSEDRALMQKMALLIGTDMLCWFPTLFFGITAAMGHPLISLSNAKIFLVFFFPINAFSNPFLYVFMTKVVQRRVKKKTAPALRRIVSTPVFNRSTLSNLYSSHPPGREGNSKRERSNSKNHLTATQITSANSSPRESNASNVVELTDTPRRTPRVSFEEKEIILNANSPPPHSKRNFFNFKRSWKKISAIPETSENSNSEVREPLKDERDDRDSDDGDNEQETHMGLDTADSERTQFLHDQRRDSQPSPWRQSISILRRKRDESTRSNGDSGRGSMSSILTGSNVTYLSQERSSLSTAGQSSDGERTPDKRMSEPHVQPIFGLGATSDDADGDDAISHEHRHKWRLFHWNRRRPSRNDAGPELVITECSESSSNQEISTRDS